VRRIDARIVAEQAQAVDYLRGRHLKGRLALGLEG
jgi:hypothetical protein